MLLASVSMAQVAGQLQAAMHNGLSARLERIFMARLMPNTLCH